MKIKINGGLEGPSLWQRLIHFLTAREIASVAASQSSVPAESEEVYKTISEDILLSTLQKNNSGNVGPVAPKTSNENEVSMTIVQENNVNDGADEQMLGAEDTEKITGRREEVKFIKGDHQNGDAKIDIGSVNGKAFTGMTKEELMKYANDPFWIRLRWIFFIGFWAIWVGMLVGAILIIIDAPKCAAPEPLSWSKSGLHAKCGTIDLEKTVPVSNVEATSKIEASGAIYELPAFLTYRITEQKVEAKIKEIVALHKAKGVNVIFDLTPNIVPKDSQLVKDALENEDKLSAFVWAPAVGNALPTNWKKIGSDQTAWSKVDSHYLLSQFDDNTYDLRMNDKIVKSEFSKVLKHLLEWGVKGFRLKNTKFYMISPELNNETISSNPKDKSIANNHYGFYNHEQTVFQNGLGDLLYDYMAFVKNESSDAFLSVAEDLIRPEAYQISQSGDVLGIDLPMYGKFVETLSSPDNTKLQTYLEQNVTACGNHSWLQWDMANVKNDTPADLSAIMLFMSALPGVPIVPVDSQAYVNVSHETFKHIKELRKSLSYMHGELEVFDAPSVIAYTRIKSGNPGFFVVYNPTAEAQIGNFTNLGDVPSKMTVDLLSDNFKNPDIKPKVKVDITTLVLEPYATVILTYVPSKKE